MGCNISPHQQPIIVGPAPYNYMQQGADWSKQYCHGEQSPIDIPLSNTSKIESGVDLQLCYNSFKPRETIVGFDIHHYKCQWKADQKPGRMKAQIGTNNHLYYFDVRQFHFHGGAEHTINGKRHDLEMHIVHEQPMHTLDRPFAVLGIIFKKGEENEFLKRLIKFQEVSWDLLFPNRIQDYLHYEGGLTTPGCQECVNWFLWSEVFEASEAQIEYISGKKNRRMIEVDGWCETYREVQDLNDRKVWQWGDTEGLTNTEGAGRQRRNSLYN